MQSVLWERRQKRTPEILKLVKSRHVLFHKKRESVFNNDQNTNELGVPLQKDFLMTNQILHFPPVLLSPSALVTTNHMEQKSAFSPNLGSSQTTNMDRPEQSLGTSSVWETLAFLVLTGANTATQCKMKPAHSCTFGRRSPEKKIF